MVVHLQATWSSEIVQSAQLVTRTSRDVALNELYEYCLPPPNFAPLDPYSEDRTLPLFPKPGSQS